MKKNAALPGRPVRGSATGRPIMAALDLVGRRWALRILWELKSEPRKFVELQKDCNQLSPTLLSTRLRELSAAALVIRNAEGGYRLTEIGQDLLDCLAPLNTWAKTWETRLSIQKQ
jgi:DNA-binding HxlR family transcriptional regulator